MEKGPQRSMCINFDTPLILETFEGLIFKFTF